MKIKTLLKTILLVSLLASISGCTHESAVPCCRISKFLWDNQWHQVYYNGAGRVTDMVSPDSSRIFFHYNAADLLTAAEIYRSGPTPAYRYKFVHGPYGIAETNEYNNFAFGTELTRTLFHYASTACVDYIIHQEFGTDTAAASVPGFEIRYNVTYTNNNVSRINGTSSEINTTYRGSRYDKKNNPFRLLAIAVGNPAFFPVDFMANFPVSHYDISLLSLFSLNNPLMGEYEIVGSGLDPDIQNFANTYTGDIAKKITWTNATSDVRQYEFEYDCGSHSSKGE